MQVRTLIKFATAGVISGAAYAFAAGPPQPPATQPSGPPTDEIVQDATNAFQTWSGSNNYFVKSVNALFTAYRSLKDEDAQLKSENAQLKDELSKLKATQTPPAPISTPVQKP